MSEHNTNHYLLFLTIPKWAQIGKFDRHTAHFFFGTGLGRSQVLFQNVMERTYAGDPDSLEFFFNGI